MGSCVLYAKRHPGTWPVLPCSCGPWAEGDQLCPRAEPSVLSHDTCLTLCYTRWMGFHAWSPSVLSWHLKSRKGFFSYFQEQMDIWKYTFRYIKYQNFQVEEMEPNIRILAALENQVNAMRPWSISSHRDLPRPSCSQSKFVLPSVFTHSTLSPFITLKPLII